MYVFSALVVFAVIRAAAGYWTNEKLTEMHAALHHTYTAVISLRDLQDLLLDAETGARTYIITGEEESYVPFTNAKGVLESKLSEVQRLIKNDNAEQAQRFEELVELARKTMADREKIINTMKKGKRDEAIALTEASAGVQLMKESREKAKEMIEAELRDIDPLHQALMQREFDARVVVIGGLGLSLSVFLFLFFYISRHVVLPIRSVTTTIARASAEIAASVEQQERPAFSRSSGGETTATIEELERSFHQMNEAAYAAGIRANQAIALAEEGSKSVDQSLAGITDLKEKVSAIAEQILRRSEQTSQIGAVINLVSDLATQTNMLALNAAVEAARAGEHGKGFFVVATEIRKLADQSRKSAEKVHTLVADIRKTTDTTVMVTEEGTKTAAHGMALAHSTAAAFNSLQSSLGTIVEGFQQTQSSINQQLTVVKRIAQAMKADVAQLKNAVQKLEEIV
jgi:methyl-accepting chemotaxis protein